jgi:histidinol-phosphate aminotransferase
MPMQSRSGFANGCGPLSSRPARLKPRSPTGLAAGYHSPQYEVEVRLNTNESPEPPPVGFREQLKLAVGRLEPHRYPDRDAHELREALATHHGVRPEQVFCANGSNEVLQCLLLAYGGPSRHALVFEPTYALHSHIARITTTEVVTGTRDSHFAVDPIHAVALSKKHQPAITFLCSPNNPTGNAEHPAAIAEIVQSSAGLVVVDEAYGQFAGSSAVGLLEDSPDVAVVRTFSKTWSMAALRLGYLLGDAQLVEELHRVVLPYHLDSLKQAAGVIALGFAAEMDERVARVRREREHLEAAMALLEVDLWPSQANFICFRPRNFSAQQTWQRLLDQSVLVRDISTFPRLEGCLRVTVGTPPENERFLSALNHALSTP